MENLVIDDKYTLPPMAGSELFIHNIDSAPAYWWLNDLWIVLAEAKDTGGRFSMMLELLPKARARGRTYIPGPTKPTTSFTVSSLSSLATRSRPGEPATSFWYHATRGMPFVWIVKPRVS